MTVLTLFPLPPPAPGAPIVLEGRVRRVLFHDTASLFSAVRLSTARGEIGAVGEFLSVAQGDEFTLTGRWEQHPKYGPQFKVLHAVKKLPRGTAAIEAYLAGGLFPGVGKASAQALVSHFGAATLEILLAAPERVEEVRRIGKKRRERLVAALRQHAGMQDLALFLQGHGVSLFLTKKIHERYGLRALEVVQADPYRVAEEVPGIGFLRADAMARKTGLPADAPARVRAAVAYILRERCETQGHSFLPHEELVRQAQAFLNRDAGEVAIRAATIAAAISDLVAADILVQEPAGAVYVSAAREAEVKLAAGLRSRMEAPALAVAGEALEAAIAAAQSQAQLVYAPEQRAAIRQALLARITIVTGGPGTGKSTVIRGVVAALRHLIGEAKVLLAAPTGRAAKRMTEVTGEEAKTIHRLLEFSPEAGAFCRHAGNRLQGDLLVVDEASMADLYLAQALIGAAPAEMRILLVGDADQLPSVGFGNVFADLIRSQLLPVVRLQTIFRQGRESLIVPNAHLINQGRMPALGRAPDWEFRAIEDPAEAAEFIRATAIAERAAGRPLSEIVVLTPMRKTETGTVALNALLQGALNPPAPGVAEVRLGERLLRVGDRVMQTRNHYGKDVFNGDIGIFAGIRLTPEMERKDEEDEEDDEEEFLVDFPSGRIAYARHELDQLILAYACTVHKAQGSEYRGLVIVPVMRQHFIMLQRNLLYTAITRAKERVLLVGQVAAIRRAVTNTGNSRRYSRLAERLRGAA